MKNSKTQSVTNLKNWIVTKLKNSNCDKTQKLKLWQNLMVVIVMVVTINYFSKNNSTRWKPMRCSKSSVWFLRHVLVILAMFFGDSKSQRTSKSHYWFRSYGGFAEWVEYAYWWSFSGGGSAINGATFFKRDKNLVCQGALSLENGDVTTVE